MTVNECIQAYRDMAKRAFSPEAQVEIPEQIQKKKKKGMAFMVTSGSTLGIPTSSSSMFSAVGLEDAMKLTIKSFCVEAKCKAAGFNGSQLLGHARMNICCFETRIAQNVCQQL